MTLLQPENEGNENAQRLSEWNPARGICFICHRV